MKNNNINTMKRGSRSVVSTTLATAYIEHSFSIHSAYIGSRWQTGGKLLRIAAMMCLLLTVGVGNAWGQSTTYTSNVTLTTTGGTNAATCSVTINSSSYSGIKLGTNGNNGAMKFTVPAGHTTVYVHAAAWNGESGTMTATISAGSITAGSSMSLTADGGVKSSSPFTLSTPANASSSYFFTLTLSSSNSARTITLTSASKKRAVVWGINTVAASCTTSPTVTAGSNSSVTKNSARVTCSSGISSLGSAGCSITSYGFVLGTSSNPTTSNTTYEVGTSYTSTGVSFYKDITGLSSGTTYYVRPYATNGNGTAYGTQTTFTTLFEASITLNKNTSDAGSTAGSAKAVENATALSSLSAPTRTGYTVEGYYTTSGCTTKVAAANGNFVASITVSGNTWTNSSSQWKRNNNETFYAKWTVNTYSVRFNKNNNDASGSMSNESFTYGESKALTSCAFSLTGYTFAGWATTSGGSVTYSDGQSVSNLSSTNGATVDLYAKWTVNNYTVTWKVNNTNYTTGSPSDNVNHGSRVAKLPTDPDPDDYCGDKFIGWTDATDGAYVHGTSTLFTTAGTAPVASGAQIFYAVFADYTTE